ncbi:MAG: guanine permease [bacterium (Candidatus Stahlbacteria) CG23_combo_of_CG06-09_8_20_14_all_40_9]|nr:MAG: guanine permease [bacterium (Candidatus Stahlbacteria) CG23_combo_of_CG06-09_8_20_14_all_40_9]
MIERIFKLEERGSKISTEILAGFVTFMTMAYIIFVNPMLLSKGGVPFEGAVMATVLSAAITCIVMGLFVNLPFALAAGMGYNAFFAFTVCGTMHVPWQTALGCVFWDGLIFVVIALSPWRENVLKGIPTNLKLAASVGIGMFIAFIGLSSAGIVTKDPATMIALGDIRSPSVLLALGGLLFTSFLLGVRVKGALLWGIIATAFAGMLVRSGGVSITPIPHALTDIMKFPSRNAFVSVFMQLDIIGAMKLSLLPVIFTFIFFDLFDTIGSIAGLAAKLNILDKKGSFPRAGRVLIVDAFGTLIGSFFGTTTVTTYIESAAGVAEGGRTGLTAFVVGILFLLGFFFAPFASIIPASATAPALVLVGVFMMEPILKINWKDITESLPAFLTIIIMPLTNNISHGLAAGIVSYTLLKLITGRAKNVSWLLYIFTVLFIIYYAFAYKG